MQPKEPIVRLVDDDENLLFSTRMFLEAMGWKVAVYSSPLDFLEKDNHTLAGCVVLDVRMPQMTGLEVQDALIERGFAALPLIFLSGHGDVRMAVRTMSKGAVTFLEKPVEPEDLHEAVTKAVNTSVAQMDEARQKQNFRNKFRLLTAREKEILLLVSEGLSNKEIADQLGLSLPTVKMHRARGSEKLEISGASELTRAFMLLDDF